MPVKKSAVGWVRFHEKKDQKRVRVYGSHSKQVRKP